MSNCKVFLVASPRKSYLQQTMRRFFSVYPDIWNRGSNHWAVTFWFPTGEWMRYEPGVHGFSLRGHLCTGTASSEEELALPGERKELVGELNTTRDAVFDRFRTYNGLHYSEPKGVAGTVQAGGASGTLPPTAQRDWVQGFLCTFEDLKKKNIDAPVKKLEQQMQ